MSMMRCEICEKPVNTDDDTDSVYVVSYECVCSNCVNENQLQYQED